MPPPVKDVKPTTKFCEPRALPESLWGDVCKLRKIAMAEKLEPRVQVPNEVAKNPSDPRKLLRSPTQPGQAATHSKSTNSKRFRILPSGPVSSHGFPRKQFEHLQEDLYCRCRLAAAQSQGLGLVDRGRRGDIFEGV